MGVEGGDDEINSPFVFDFLSTVFHYPFLCTALETD